MARWGTGKTTVIKQLSEDLKNLYNTIEINLWNLTNALSSGNREHSEDSSFVRLIVKEALTQLLNNEELINTYMNSSEISNEFKSQNDLRTELLQHLFSLSIDTNQSTFLKERSKFLDQHIYSLTRITQIIFNNTFKPTIFVFDDLDRIEDETKVVELLDALIAFLNMPNAVYIIPMDEAKIIKAITNTKVGKDPYSFINKYFTYSIRAPFIPRLNMFKELIDIVKELNIKNIFIDEHKKEKLENCDLLRKSSSIFPQSYRDIKDYLNAFQNNYFILLENKFVKKLIKSAQIRNRKINDQMKKELIMVTTILQIQAPLLGDYFAGDMNRKDSLFKILDIKNDVDSDLSQILKLLIEWDDNLPKENQNNKNNLSVKDSEFWYSLLNIEISKKEYTKHIDLVREIDKSIKSEIEKYQKLQNLLVSKIQTILKVFRIFDLSGPKNSQFQLIFWTLFTLAEINDPEAINFAEDNDLFDIFSSDNSNAFNDKIKEFEEQNQNNNLDTKNIIEKIKMFLDKTHSYKSTGFISIDEYKKILENTFSNETNLSLSFSDDNFVNDIVDAILEETEISQNYLNISKKLKLFFKGICKETRSSIIKKFNSRKWMHNQNNNTRAIQAKTIKPILELNHDIINIDFTNKLNFNNYDQKITLEEKWKFEFLNKYKEKVEFEDFIPLDLNDFKKSKNEFKRLLDFFKEIKTKIKNLEEITNQIKPDFFTNKLIKDIKNVDNLWHFIMKNKDFKNLHLFQDEVIQKLNDSSYFIDNIDNLLKFSPKIFEKQIAIDTNEKLENRAQKTGKKICLMNLKPITQAFINHTSKLMNKSKTSIIYKYREILLNSKAPNDIIEIIINEIDNYKNAQDNNIQLIKIILDFDNEENKLKHKYQTTIGFDKKLAYQGEPILASTPISEIINGNARMDSKNKFISKSQLIDKIDKSHQNQINAFFNLYRNNNLCESLANIFLFLNEKDGFRFYDLSRICSSSSKQTKKENNEELIEKINNKLNFKSLEKLSKKPMPDFRLKAIKKQIKQFENEINRYKEYGQNYNQENFNKIKDSNDVNDKFLKKWIGITNEKNKKLSDLKIRAIEKKKLYDNYMKKIQNINLIYKDEDFNMKRFLIKTDWESNENFRCTRKIMELLKAKIKLWDNHKKNIIIEFKEFKKKLKSLQKECKEKKIPIDNNYVYYSDSQIKKNIQNQELQLLISEKEKIKKEIKKLRKILRNKKGYKKR